MASYAQLCRPISIAQPAAYPHSCFFLKMKERGIRRALF
jgi:hypothetical protein